MPDLDPRSPVGGSPAPDAPLRQGEFRCFRVLGLTVESDMEFQTPLLPATGAPDLRLQLTRGPRPPPWPVEERPSFESPIRIEDDLPLVALHRGPEGDLLRFTAVVDFYLDDEGIRAHLVDPEYAFMVEIHLLGVVLSYWLERQGIPVLHASAVSVAGRAVGFMGTNQGGKSSLAVALMLRSHPLISDDLLGLQASDAGILARPGFPSMRMWPDLARTVLGSEWERAPLAHPRLEKRRIPVGPEGFGRFEDRTRPLACLYLPTRHSPGDGATDIRIQDVPPGEAVFELLRGSFLTRLPGAAGLTAGRLELFTQLARTVPVRRLHYPTGFEFLPRVTETILAELDLRGDEGQGGETGEG